MSPLAVPAHTLSRGGGGGCDTCQGNFSLFSTGPSASTSISSVLSGASNHSGSVVATDCCGQQWVFMEK
jgi:hypothetical protein